MENALLLWIPWMDLKGCSLVPSDSDFDGLRIITRAIRASGATIREIYRVELTPKTVVPVVRCGKVETTTISLQMKLFFRVPNF